MRCYYIILLSSIPLFLGCSRQTDLTTEQVQVESYVEAVSEHDETPMENSPDSVFFVGRSVVFFTPKSNELEGLFLDEAAREGLNQSVGDFAYYARKVSDSLQSSNVAVHFTNSRIIVFENEDQKFDVDRILSGSPIGLILFNGHDAPTVFPGMQTHLSLFSSINDYFYDERPDRLPLLDYFEPLDVNSIHIYSSHSDILNQTGSRIDPYYYSKLGTALANRAGKFRMSVFAYHMFALKDSLAAIICRVPSRYDESSVRLYIWDDHTDTVIKEIELAENIWNEKWILVKDSWIHNMSDPSRFSIIQRKREARMTDGQRTEIDSLFQWQWDGHDFKSLSTQGLSIDDFPLKDWDSYQEPKKVTEITLVDQDYVWLPLQIGDLTWENVILEIPKPYVINKDPIPNQLVPNQIDTLVSIVGSKVKFTFYRSPENNIVIGGVISDPTMEFKNGLKVGISKNEFAAAFKSLNESTIPDLVKISSKQKDRIISYSFQNDILVRIELANYID